MSERTTLITVTYDEMAFLPRFFRMLDYYCPSTEYSRHIIWDNNSESDAKKFWLQSLLRPNTLLVFHDENLGDLPAINRMVAEYVDTEFFVVISPDARLLDGQPIEVLEDIWKPNTAIIGNAGPGWDITPENWETKAWGWVGQVLVQRDLEFDCCKHAQTWFFLSHTETFKEIGGFWEPPPPPEDWMQRWTHKGDLIAAEIEFSVRARMKGYDIIYKIPHSHHYGSGAKSEEELNEFDRRHGFRVPF